MENMGLTGKAPILRLVDIMPEQGMDFVGIDETKNFLLDI